MRASRPYGRSLLKISGEALAGDRDFGYEAREVSRIAYEIAQACGVGTELGVVIGAGNMVRGVAAASLGVPPLVGDQMGMVATLLNAMVLRSALDSIGVPSCVMSAFPVGHFVETFQLERAINHVTNGRVVIFAGGTGNPCFTTDTAAALRAVQIDAEVMIKATHVRGVFDKDPRKHPDAIFFDTITHQEVLTRGLKVMDAASVEILSRNNIPTIVLNLHEPGNIARALAGEHVGTLIA